uniref:Uncharacterized protein n=1 Tax=Strongyloides papillosus TaxID=174720 RepID=A0A0N5BFW4_STREA
MYYDLFSQSFWVFCGSKKPKKSISRSTYFSIVVICYYYMEMKRKNFLLLEILTNLSIFRHR